MTAAFRRMQLATEWEPELDLQSQQSPDIRQQEQSHSTLAFESHEHGPTENNSFVDQQDYKDEFRHDTEFEAEAAEIQEAFPTEDEATLQLFRVLAEEGRDLQALHREQAPCDQPPDRLASAEFAARLRLSNEPKEESKLADGEEGVVLSLKQATAMPERNSS